VRNNVQPVCYDVAALRGDDAEVGAPQMQNRRDVEQQNVHLPLVFEVVDQLVVDLALRQLCRNVTVFAYR
jgi:hypothetical protein